MVGKKLRAMAFLAIAVFFLYSCNFFYLSKVGRISRCTGSISKMHGKAKKLTIKDLNFNFNVEKINFDKYEYYILYYDLNLNINDLDFKNYFFIYHSILNQFNLKSNFRNLYLIDKKDLPESFVICYPPDNLFVIYSDSYNFINDFVSSISSDLHEQFHQRYKISRNLRWFNEGSASIPMYLYYKAIKKFPNVHFLKIWLGFDEEKFKEILKWKYKIKFNLHYNEKEILNYSYSIYICLRFYLIDPEKYIQLVLEISKQKRQDIKNLEMIFNKIYGFSIYDYNLIMKKSKDAFIDFLINLKADKEKSNDLNKVINELIKKENSK